MKVLFNTTEKKISVKKEREEGNTPLSVYVQ
jgi:hypothetical protein